MINYNNRKWILVIYLFIVGQFIDHHAEFGYCTGFDKFAQWHRHVVKYAYRLAVQGGDFFNDINCMPSSAKFITKTTHDIILKEHGIQKINGPNMVIYGSTRSQEWIDKI